MSTENMKKICKYKKELEETLTELETERKNIIEKIINGEMLSSEEMQRNQELAKLIKEVKDDLELFQPLDLYEEMSKDLTQISKSKPLKAEKDALIQKLLANFAKINEVAKKELQIKANLTAEEVKDIDTLQANVEKDLQELNNDLKVFQKRNLDTLEIEKEIKEKQQLLGLIQNCKNELLDLSKIEEDLKKLAKSNTSKDDKTVILITYNTIINQYKDACIKVIEDTFDFEEKTDIQKGEISDKDKIEPEVGTNDKDKVEVSDATPTKGNTDVVDADFEEVEEDMNNEEKKSLKERTKETLAKAGETLKRNGKKIAKVGVAAALCVGIILVAKSCSKDIENNKNNDEDINNKTSIEQTYEDADRNTINALTNKGYNEYAAILMAKNFDKDTIEALTTIPYIEAVENYATVSEFNVDYLNDYENARTIYEIPANKAVDYVNRSIKIIETNFYTDATINDVVEIVMAIDNKDLFTQNNANLAQSFNTSFNRIVDNYLFGSTTEEDTKKLDALQYFAADDTDMDLFLTEFATIAKDNIENPDDKEAKDNMYNYIVTFALSLNGYTNVDEDIKVNTPYNTNAQVNDYYDWYVAYNSFIAPLYPTFVNENEFTKYEKLQYLMITAMEDPQFEMICGENRTLGGE